MRTRLLFIGYLSLVATVLSGTRGCQEDYDLGAQSNVSTTSTTLDDVISITTTTSIRTTTTTTEPDETTTTTPPGESTTSTTEPDEGPGQIIKSLQRLNTESSPTPQPSANSPSSLQLDTGTQKMGNWLGRAYTDQEEIPGVALDSDNDGFTDRLEDDFGTDPHNVSDSPPAPNSRLKNRLLGTDDDFDGTSNTDETLLGTDPTTSDSDHDGIKDGAERLSKSDPLDEGSRPYDSDRDGLSDDYEARHGTNMREADTDQDGALDSTEFAVGSNPRDNDTDKDGVLDGKELEFGADPVTPES